ncbi:hypothetical protein V5799_021654 [Amblyomma americanum]|uniref:Uncharacterized protein n=1 Tax=Amblyomma americanum TaxID=6943 RepID=A0AAQ4FPM3_AMBAM
MKAMPSNWRHQFPTVHNNKYKIVNLLILKNKIVTGLNFTNCKVKRSSVEACFCTRPSSVESFHWLYWRSILSLCTGWISLEVKIGAPSHHSQ